MADIQVGEIVDIIIKGARVVDVTRHGDGNGDDLRFRYEAKDGEAWPSAVWADAPGVTVTRVAPAEWPPQPGDLWRDPDGTTWYLVEWDLSGASPRLVTFGSRSEVRMPDTITGSGWTLVHREQQDGGETS